MPRPFSSEVRVDFGALSHPGKVRTNNEDSYLVVRFDRGLETLLTNLPEGYVPRRFQEVGYGMTVADGVGGSASGEVASRLAITTLVTLVLNQPDWLMRLGEPESKRVMRRMARRLRQVDEALKEEAATDRTLAGMATTLTLACSLGSDLFLAHVGDSRAYYYRGTELHPLTRDHTYVRALADLGILRPEAALTHRLRHVLTRALGGRAASSEAEVQRLQLGDGDQVLLCTDGLTDLVDNATIAAVLSRAGPAREACKTLVDLALERGGKDNVTVVLARYRFPATP
jgi:protein phosphatase